MATKVNLDEVPRALRVEALLKFITGALEEWKTGRGLQGGGLAADLQRAQVDEFIAEMWEFHRRHFPKSNVAALPEREERSA